jgi:hypothetical protein
MDVSLAGAVASKANSGAVALKFTNGVLQESMVFGNVPSGTKVVLCCSWVNAQIAPRLRAFATACQEVHRFKVHPPSFPTIPHA